MFAELVLVLCSYPPVVQVGKLAGQLAANMATALLHGRCHVEDSTEAARAIARAMAIAAESCEDGDLGILATAMRNMHGVRGGIASLMRRYSCCPRD